MSGLWTEILTDFDPEEETANFGTRLSLVTEGSLYEVHTVPFYTVIIKEANFFFLKV
jgi:hypothetical protein